MSPENLLGWFASSLVFAAFYSREMLTLRLLAIASNVAFIAYGYANQLWPIVFLHASMLPMNIVRLRQAARTFRTHAPVASSPGKGSASVLQDRSRTRLNCDFARIG